MCYSIFFFFFFFQAEDGIRDWSVTGVQTCALPICSYDTGKRIVREVFGGEPPYPVPFEWIALKGQGDMSSSKGNLVSIVNLTQTIPPEVVRYMVFRVKPMRSITFDPGLPLLNLVDEYDDVQ